MIKDAREDSRVSGETNDKGSFRPRNFWNALVSGHRFDRLPADNEKQVILKNTLREIIGQLQRTCSDKNKTLRLLAGNSDGVDQWTYELNNELFKAPFFRIASFHNENLESFPHVHDIYLSEHPFSPVPETWISATDEIKLDYADLMIAVWDGKSPRGNMGGVVRLLIESLKRHIPVILIDASLESLGTILLSHNEKTDSSLNYRLKIEENNFSWVKSDLFEKAAINEINSLFSKKIKNENDLLKKFYIESAKIDPTEKKTCSGMFHEVILRLFGKKWKKKFAPIKAYRGKKQSFLEKKLPEEFWQYFDMFDRTATHAANKYRDKVVGIHLLASLAVLGAVLGAIVQSDGAELFWGLVELVALGWIVTLLRERKEKINSHDVWLYFRKAAEAFRINVFLRSQLSSLPQLHESIWSEGSERHESEASSSVKPKIRLADPSLWVVTQLFHEAGPPGSDKKDSQSGKEYILTKNRQELIVQMRELIEDQKSYHDGNQEENLKVHESIEGWTVFAFAFIFLVVILHLISSMILSWRGEDSSFLLSDVIKFLHNRYALFFTAFLPALVAAFHDIHSQLELNRVSKNSQEMSERLGALLNTLQMVEKEENPMILRNLARELAQTLYQEHAAWGKLMKDQHLDVPA